MAITLTEKVASREWTTGQRESVTLRYIVDGTSDDAAAKAHLLANAPATFGGLVLDDATLDPIVVDETGGTGKWDCTVRYVPSEGSWAQTGDSAFSFDTTGGTQHTTQSLRTIGYAAPGKSLDNFKGAIGVSHDRVEGVDIVTPVYAFGETHYLADSIVTDSYRGRLFALTGRVNHRAFKGLAAGECLFLGASGSQRSGGDWEITFGFAASPNRTNIVVGSIKKIAKKGWEYMWVRYADVAGSEGILKHPIAVYIEQVYEYGNLSLLGI